MKWMVAVATIVSVGVIPFAWWLVMIEWGSLSEERRLLVVLLMLLGHAVAAVAIYNAVFLWKGWSQ